MGKIQIFVGYFSPWKSRKYETLFMSRTQRQSYSSKDVAGTFSVLYRRSFAVERCHSAHVRSRVPVGSSSSSRIWPLIGLLRLWGPVLAESCSGHYGLSGGRFPCKESSAADGLGPLQGNRAHWHVLVWDRAVLLAIWKKETRTALAEQRQVENRRYCNSGHYDTTWISSMMKNAEGGGHRQTKKQVLGSSITI